VAKSIPDAVDHIARFYRLYHSSRYVGPILAMRLRQRLADSELDALNSEFSDLVKEGKIEQTGPLEGEQDHLELPRLAFMHSRNKFGRLRKMIDRINGFSAA
jgi:hypothetical protein